MFSQLNLAIFDAIETFFESIANSLQYEFLLYILLGAFLLFAIMIFIKTRFSYEVRAIKSFKKINKYFLKKPYINESNLVEFNILMKRLPYQLRDRWQYYMLNREGLPSTYMTLYHCVEQPIKTSTYKSTVKLARSISIIIMAIGLVIGLLVAGSGTLTIDNVVRAFIGPFLVFLLSEIYIIFLRSRFNALSIDLYEYFIVFTRNLDKASVSIPDYVDYELLFTNKEIREGIPVLREYLEKKALLEQVALEKAKANLEEREKFDFSKYGIDGSLILERAMETSQDFLNSRRRLLEEINKLEQEKEKNNSSYLDAEKNAQKKLQTIKENLDRMSVLMEESASRIEQNYIKKQQAEEVTKRDQIEKDLEDMRLKFAQEMQFIEAEIKKKQDEISNGKNEVAEAMDSEFETYSEKVYISIKNQLEQDKNNELILTKKELDKIREVVDKDEQQLENNKVELELKEQQIDTLKSEYETVTKELELYSKTDKRGIKELFNQNSEMQSQIKNMRNQLVKYKQLNNETVYFDENGNFVDIESFKDKKGKFKELPKVYDVNGNLVDFELYYNKNGELLNNIEDAPVLGNFEDNIERARENVEINGIENDNLLDNSNDLVVNNEEFAGNQEESVSEENHDVNQVYYNENGDEVDLTQYMNEDGSFKALPKVYDEEGNYHDFADYYNMDGSLIGQDNQSVEEGAQEENINDVEETLNENEAQEQEEQQVVYYDENGNEVDFTKYYNEDGSFKEFPKVYDEEGNYYDFADYYDINGNLLGQENQTEEDTENVIQKQDEDIFDEESIDNLSENETPIENGESGELQPIIEEVQEEPAKVEGNEIIYYDEKGSPVDFEQFYAEDGTFKEFPKVYDAYGNFYDFSKFYDKYGTPLTQSNEGEKEDDAPKRKRGRPRKEKTIEEIEKPKRPRGRPRKQKQPSENDNAPKRKRGRPRKTEEVKKENEAPKKRGRPAKNKVDSEEIKTHKRKITRINDEFEDVNEEFASKRSMHRIDNEEENNSLASLDTKISAEKEKLKQQKKELKAQISQTLTELQGINTEDSDLKELRQIISKLKKQASEAKKNGLSKAEQQKINKSLAELLRAMAQKR